jgi:two-component system nitrate/nitrite sensor histidine kinase NarX
MLFHIAREALTNARKHASPTWIRVALDSASDRVHLEIEDDGHGFDCDVDLPEQHRGLRNMRSRAAAAGADLVVKSAPGNGTTVIVDLPTDSKQTHRDGG